MEKLLGTQSTSVLFRSKGTERRGLLIPDPQQLKGVLLTRLSELPAQNSEASEPYSDDDAESDQNPGENKNVQEQLVTEEGGVPWRCFACTDDDNAMFTCREFLH